MTGGDIKIEVLPAGAVVPAFGLLDAVSKGTLDGGHGVLAYSYGKQNALALWGSGPGLRDGRQHAAVVAQVRRRQGAAQQALRVDRRQRRVLPVRAAPDAAARLVQEADHQGRRLQGHEVPHRGHLDRPVHGHGRRGERAPRRRDRSGDGPRAARRRRVQQRVVRSAARLPGRLQGVHAAELPPERRAVRGHLQQDEVRCSAREAEDDHLLRRRRGHPPT